MIVELMVALGVVTMGVMAMVALLARSLSLNRVVADQYTATYLASEGIEVVKNIIDHNVIRALSGEPVAWNDNIENGMYEVEYDTDENGCCVNDIASGAERKLLFDSDTGFFGYGAGAGTSFTRLVRITRVGDNELNVSSVVNWTTRGGGSFSVELEDHFFNWAPIPSPAVP